MLDDKIDNKTLDNKIFMTKIFQIAELKSLQVPDKYAKSLYELIKDDFDDGEFVNICDYILKHEDLYNKMPEPKHFYKHKENNTKLSQNQNEELNLFFTFSPAQERELIGYPKTKMYAKKSKELFNITDKTLNSMLVAKESIEELFKDEYEENINFAMNECYKYKKGYPAPAKVKAELNGNEKCTEEEREVKELLAHLRNIEPTDSLKLKNKILCHIKSKELRSSFSFCFLSEELQTTLIIKSPNEFVLDEIHKGFEDVLHKVLGYKYFEYFSITDYEDVKTFGIERERLYRKSTKGVPKPPLSPEAMAELDKVMERLKNNLTAGR
jgi:hypothetical protein